MSKFCKIYPLGTKNIWIKFHGNHDNSSPTCFTIKIKVNFILMIKKKVSVRKLYPLRTTIFCIFITTTWLLYILPVTFSLLPDWPFNSILQEQIMTFNHARRTSPYCSFILWFSLIVFWQEHLAGSFSNYTGWEIGMDLLPCHFLLFQLQAARGERKKEFIQTIMPMYCWQG